MKYLNTYGKQKTMLSDWVSIQDGDRKQVFDSTSSESSVQQAPKPRRKSQRKTTVKRRKATKTLPTSDDEEEDDVFTYAVPPSRSTARPKPSKPIGRPIRAGKRKPLVQSVSSDEENVAPTPNIRRGRRKKPISNNDDIPDGNKCPLVSYQSSGSKSRSSEKEKTHHNTILKDSIVGPSAGRFVTRRRFAVSSKAHLLSLNSSEDFAPLKRTSRNPLKKQYPLVLLESSADISVNAAVFQGIATIPLKEISLNESVERSLGPCSRKPIFCSTPSAAPLNKKSKLESFHQVSSPVPISISCIDSVSPELINSPHHASAASVEKPVMFAGLQKHSQLHHETLSSNVTVALSNCLNGSGQSQYKEAHLSSPSLPLVISDSDVSSFFKSASGEIDWLKEYLKTKCLTQLCTVRLENIEDLIQLFTETTYSSCLGSVCSSNVNEHSLSVVSSHMDDHVKHSELPSSLDLAAPCDNMKSPESSKSVDVVFEPSVSDKCSELGHTSTIDLFCESEMQQVQDLTQDLSSTIEKESLSRECSVIVQKLPQSRIEPYLIPEPRLYENEPMRFHNQTTADSQFNETHNETSELKEKCLVRKPLVKINKLSIAEIKHKLQENISDRSVSVLGRVSDGKMDRLKENRDTMCRNETSACSNNEPSKKRGKISLASEERACGTQRPGTTRKACVSGLSVKRWKSRDAFTASFGQRGGTKTMDCSINDLMPRQHRQPMDFTTPIKGHNLNLSSLLAELTPSTHTWSRLKAALSIHRKVIHTPKTPGASMSSRKVLEAFSPDLFTTPVRPARSQLITRESQLVLDSDDMSDAEKVCAECSQQGPLAWDQCLLPQRMKRCVKIGEGTFGEVFSTTSGKPDGEIVALKVIPVEGSEKVNGEEQKTFGEILHEIIISKELSCLKEKENNQTSGFIGLRDLHCVKGGYPPEFLKAWDKFDKVKGSENDRPDFFRGDQLFIILEFEFGGTDLENSNGALPSIIVAKGILHQVTAALAVAEQELQFEHRDLHWGNVLVKVTKEKTAEFRLNGTYHSLETKGVLVRIIDYSLSRLEIDELTVSCDISNDEELFMGQGDYQFDIYRMMRQENNNEWGSYNPHSNVLWLHYLCSKLLHMKYRRSAGKRNKDELTSFYDNVLQFRSATEVLWNSPLFQ